MIFVFTSHNITSNSNHPANYFVAIAYTLPFLQFLLSISIPIPIHGFIQCLQINTGIGTQTHTHSHMCTQTYSFCFVLFFRFCHSISILFLNDCGWMWSLHCLHIWDTCCVTTTKKQSTFPICAGLPDYCRTLCAVNLLSCIVIGAYLFVGNGHVSLGVTITSYMHSEMETRRKRKRRRWWRRNLYKESKYHS